jgi:aryl-phospho-beta-D-glucosidase BglC (GH1 family)
MRIAITLTTLLGAAYAFPQAATSSSATSSVADQTTIASVEDVPQATSIAEVVALNVTIPVDVSSELLDSIPLNADDPALKTEDPIETNEFLSPADFLTDGLSLDDIPEVSVEQSAIGARDLSALFGSSATRGPFANFLKVATKVFINATKKIIKWTCPQFIRPKPNTFPGWRNYKSNGVNLGGWLLLEFNIDPNFFRTNAPNAIDEDSFCKELGNKACGALLEKRFNEYITTKDIDMFASYGVNTLRIPIGYWAYMPAQADVNYYTGGQLAAMHRIAQYAITKHNMHIVVDLHALPGGQNGLDNQGKTGQLTWWNNQTNFDLSIEMVKKATADILARPNAGSFTLSLINEPLPALYYFGQTQDSIAYLNKYYTAGLKAVRAQSKTLPIAISDGFIGPQTWNPYWTDVDPYIVIDTHIYFFVGGSYSYDAAYGACYLAKSYVNASNPVFIGEWSIQATLHNHLGDNTRRDFYHGQFQAYNSYLNGGMFWNGKHDGDAIVGEDGSEQKNYWSWEILAQDGIVPRPGDQLESLC